ncbi:MAG: hypothetical protein AAGF26_05655 [Cyanobacteria bacterium P01_G01_bin.49]
MNDKRLYNLLNWSRKLTATMLSFSQQLIKRKFSRQLLIITILISLTACGTVATAPIEFAPTGNIIQQAIAFQLRQQLNPLSQQLNTNRPDLEIGQINVKDIESIIIAELPTYHLQGTYNLKLILPRQEVQQKNNNFEIYLQRQAERKTWRLLSKDNKNLSDNIQWKSYLIRDQES